MVSHGNVRQQDNRISRLAAFVPIKHFGLGSASRGLMKGRIAIPIHNENGELVAYAGLEESPKWVTPRFAGRFLRLSQGFLYLLLLTFQG